MDDISALSAPSTRRAFIARASTLSLAIPGMSAALVACTSEKAGTDTTHAASPATIPSDAKQNSDSRLDTAVLKDAKHGATSTAPGASQPTAFHRLAPELS